MNIFTKLGLLAVLSANTFFGMENPQPAQPMAQVENDIIQIRAHEATIAKIERRHLKASSMLKALIDETSMDNGIELPEFLVENFKAIQDYLIHEYRIQEKIADDLPVMRLLVDKSEAELVTIINACQRFELNNVTKTAVRMLAAQLNTPERREKCLKNGSYKLNWTPDVARLVAQRMQNTILNFNLLEYLLIKEIFTNNQEESITILTKTHVHGRRTRPTNLNNFYIEHYNWSFLTDEIREKINTITMQGLGHPFADDYSEFSLIAFNHYEETYYIFHVNKKSPHTAFFKNSITPEQVTLIQHLIEVKKGMQKQAHYAGLSTINNSLPRSIQNLISQTTSLTWWQRRSWYSKAAVIGGATAIAGIVGWYAYKALVNSQPIDTETSIFPLSESDLSLLKEAADRIKIMQTMMKNE